MIVFSEQFNTSPLSLPKTIYDGVEEKKFFPPLGIIVTKKLHILFLKR